VPELHIAGQLSVYTGALLSTNSSRKKKDRVQQIDDQPASLFGEALLSKPKTEDADAHALLSLFFFRRILDHRALSLCVQHFRPLSRFFQQSEGELKAFFAQNNHLRGYVDASQLASGSQRAGAFRYAERMEGLMRGPFPGSLVLSDNPRFVPRLRNSRLGIHWVFCHPSARIPMSGPAVAIIGSRDSTRQQLEAACDVAHAVGAMRGTVITGLATGADAAAHTAARDTEALLVAVLGSGVAKPYPPSSSRLVEELLSGRGTVLTEVPPDYTPNADAFVLRNRIVAALADVVVAVSGKYASGTAHTIRFAADAKVPVLSADPAPNSGITKLVLELGGEVMSPDGVRATLAREEE
jgi:hypothetical protein